MSVLAFSTVVLRQSGIRGQNGLTGTNVFSEEINHGAILMVRDFNPFLASEKQYKECKIVTVTVIYTTLCIMFGINI